MNRAYSYRLMFCTRVRISLNITWLRFWIAFSFFFFFVERASVHVHRDAGHRCRCSPAHHYPGTRDGSRFIGTLCKYTALCVRLCRCIIMYHHVIYFSTRPDAGSQSLYFSKITPSQEFARITLKHIDKTQHKDATEFNAETCLPLRRMNAVPEAEVLQRRVYSLLTFERLS